MEVSTMEKEQLEQNQHAKPLSLPMLTAINGFIGGILWSGLGLLAYGFHFTEIRPNMVLEAWAIGDWKSGWLGNLISIIIIGLLGVVAAFIYYALLKKFYSIWIGILYGVILFLLVFFIFNPLFPSLNPIMELKRETIITTICLYILFGVFVGYSISYEYNEQLHGKVRESEQDDSKSV